MKQYTELDDIDNYFVEYRRSKLAGIRTKEYVSELAKYSNDDFNSDSYDVFHKWYSKINKRNFDGIDRVIALDGVGYEYCGYIVSLLSKNEKISILSADMLASKLPTITSVNKEDLESFSNFEKLVPDYDSEVIHGDYYYLVDSLEKSLTIVKRMINTILDTISAGEILCVTADHGSTVQHKLVNTTKKYYFEKSEHEGRCCLLDGSENYSKSSNDYIYYKDYDTKKEWLLSTNNFSLFNTPKREAHGGATLEEVCVPKIVFAYDKNINYKINLLTKDINSMHKVISFTVNPKPFANVFVEEENGKLLKCELKDNTYFVELSAGKTQKIKIKVQNVVFEELIKNNSMNSEGDDFF